MTTVGKTELAPESPDNIHAIIQLAAEAGRIVLENGGETNRVEDIVQHVCEIFGVKSASCFATPTGIMLSAIDTEGHTASLIKRIHSRTTNLEKLAKIKNLVYSFSSEEITINGFKARLKDIDQTKQYTKRVNILAACIGAGCFTYVYGGNAYDFIVSFFIGGIIKGVSLFLEHFNVNNFFVNVIGGALTAWIAMFSVQMHFGCNQNEIIIGALMLLVPGLAITNAIRDTIYGDYVSGTSRAVEAFLVAIGIAVGAGVVLKFWYLF
jgi:uncharacterized membrane protein YjjP (DUF1212 family)